MGERNIEFSNVLVTPSTKQFVKEFKNKTTILSVLMNVCQNYV